MNNSQAEGNKSTHMTLSELKAMIEPTTGKNVPTRKKSIESGIPVDTYRNGDYSIAVFTNGFAVEQSGRRYTVVRVDECRDYTYEVKSSYLAGTEDATPHHFDEEYFLDKPWPMRIMMEADDQLQKNEDSREQKLLSKHPDIPDRMNVLREGSGRSAEDVVMSQIERERILKSLTQKQSEVFVLYVSGYSQEEIGKLLGISRESVSKRLKGTLEKLSRTFK